MIAQADGFFRQDPHDIARLKARNTSGEMVPVGTVAQLRSENAPYRVPRYDLFPAAEVMGVAAPGVATGVAPPPDGGVGPRRFATRHRLRMDRTCFPAATEGNLALLVFGAAALFVFLVLAAQYESWKLPLAVVMIVPMCLLASVTGLLMRGMAIDVLAQIGFVVLVDWPPRMRY